MRMGKPDTAAESVDTYGLGDNNWRITTRWRDLLVSAGLKNHRELRKHRAVEKYENH